MDRDRGRERVRKGYTRKRAREREMWDSRMNSAGKGEI